jgi:hypothetical protein
VIFEVLRVGADRGELEYPVASADGGFALDNRVWADHGGGSDADLAADHHAGADFDGRVEFGARIDHSGGMNPAGYGS